MITTTEAQIILNEKRGSDDIEYVSKYQGDKSRHLFRCTRCDHKWEATPNTLKRKNYEGCPACQQKHKKKPTNKTYYPNHNEAERLRQNPNVVFATFPKEVLHKKKQLEQKHIDQKNLTLQAKKIYEASKKGHEVKKRKWDKIGIVLVFLWPIYLLLIMIPRKLLPDPIEVSYGEVRRTEEIYHYEEDTLLSIELELSDYEKQMKALAVVYRLRERIDIMPGGTHKLYYIRLRHDGRRYYKIGISKNSVESRYLHYDSELHEGYIAPEIEKIIFEAYLQNAKELERLIINAYDSLRVNNPRILRNYGGFTEVFSIDILGLD